MKKDKQVKKTSIKEKLNSVKKIATSNEVKDLLKSFKGLIDTNDIMK